MEAAERNGIGYKVIELLKGEQLGHGSYGIVCKARCDELICAAKIIHENLMPVEGQGRVSRGKEHRHPMKRFEQECEFLSTIKHPNIIQYLGTWNDDSGQPVLLMELLDSDLTKFLENASGPLPLHKQVNICHDIALALAFLHSHNIVHRDLSGKNILMIADVRAKVTDFGMATLINLSPQQLNRQPIPTTCPGTEVYMPPEALLVSDLRPQPGRSELEKIDDFSFGVITLQILTRKLPNPGLRQKLVEEWHLGRPKESVLKNIPEIERRKEHIDQVDSSHPLRQIVLDCLRDKPQKRPAAKLLCENLAKVKRSVPYSKSMEAQDQDPEMRRTQTRPSRRGLRPATQSLVELSHEIKHNMAVLSEVQEFRDGLEKKIAEGEKIIKEREKAISEKDLGLKIVKKQLKEKTALTEQQKLDLTQMHVQYKEQSKEFEQTKEKLVSWEKLNTTVQGKMGEMHEKEMELQREKEQLKRKSRQCGQQRSEHKQVKEEQVTQEELNTIICEKDKIIHESKLELEKINKQLKELSDQQSNKSKQMKEKTSKAKVPRDEFDRAIQEKDHIIHEKELKLERVNEQLKKLCEELEQTKEMCKIQARKNGTFLSDLEFTELPIPPDILPDILEGTSKIIEEGYPHHMIQLSQQSEAVSANTPSSTDVQGTKDSTDKEGEEWQSLGSIVHSIHRKDSEVIVSGNTVYIASKRSTTIEALHAYNLHSTSQSGSLPDCPKNEYSLAIVDGILTTIGGSGSSKKLYSLCYTGEEGVNTQRKWEEKFPPMPTGRQWTTALCTEECLIVAGGCIRRNGKTTSVLNNVEILDIKKQQWSIAASLPEPLYLATGVVMYGDMVHIGGGVDKGDKPTKSMYSCSLATLIKTSRPMGKQVEFKISMWDRFADLPAEWSTCVSVDNCLLAVGGTYQPIDQSASVSSHITSTAMSKVYRYNPANESWDVISYMLSARSGCFAVNLSERELMVLGGGDNAVEIAENIIP